jgi:hypothetical protein
MILVYFLKWSAANFSMNGCVKTSASKIYISRFSAIQWGENKRHWVTVNG